MEKFHIYCWKTSIHKLSSWGSKNRELWGVPGHHKHDKISAKIPFFVFNSASSPSNSFTYFSLSAFQTWSSCCTVSLWYRSSVSRASRNHAENNKGKGWKLCHNFMDFVSHPLQLHLLLSQTQPWLAVTPFPYIPLKIDLEKSQVFTI